MLEYNTSRNKLVIREYGRNIQKMIEEAVLIEDREKRNEAAKAIVKSMSFINPTPSNNQNSNNANPEVKKQKEKESQDYWRKLWDHLIIISDYRLDVDSPFPAPQPKVEALAPQHGAYKKGGIRVRTYGRYMEKIIRTVATYPDGPEKEQLTRDIAIQMKKLYLTWNRDTVEDSLIINQLHELSQGKLSLPSDFVIEVSKDSLPTIVAPPTKAKKKRKKKKKKSSNAATNTPTV